MRIILLTLVMWISIPAAFAVTGGWVSGGSASDQAQGPINLKVSSVKIDSKGAKEAKGVDVKVPSSVALNDEIKSGGAGELPVKKKLLKLKNVKLVVEDYEDKSSERLVPVDPVALRQKPKTVAIAEVKRNSLVLPQTKLRGDGDSKMDGGQDKVDAYQKPILVISKVVEEESSVLERSSGGVGYSPFNPPAPGAFPSTLSQRETLSEGTQGSELLPLPPVATVGGLSILDPRLPPVRVARAVATDSRLNYQYGNPAAPPGSQNQAPGFASYYTDSESSALLQMAAEPKGFEGPTSSVFGQMW